jgi:hypothetical protein
MGRNLKELVNDPNMSQQYHHVTSEFREQEGQEQAAGCGRNKG